MGMSRGNNDLEGLAVFFDGGETAITRFARTRDLSSIAATWPAMQDWISNAAANAPSSEISLPPCVNVTDLGQTSAAIAEQVAPETAICEPSNKVDSGREIFLRLTTSAQNRVTEDDQSKD